MVTIRGGSELLLDIGNRAMKDLPVGAIRLAQQMPRIRFATPSDVRGIDIHSGYYNKLLTILCQE